MMARLVQAVRSLLFYIAYIGQTVVLALVVGSIELMTRQRPEAPSIILRIGRYWGESNKTLLRVLVGIRSDVTGGENMPAGGCLIVSKHQSDWDIFAMLPFAAMPAFIAKKELLDIPFFGWAARRLNTIPIDRKRGAEAIPQMLRDAQAAVDKGAQIIIFPEGTRKAPLASPDYRQGMVRLYVALGVPVVPVALNSGLYWGRNSLILWPGVARAKILEPIPPGLDAETFRARLVATIEQETNDLIREAASTGLARPLTAEFRARLQSLIEPDTTS
jgi:1-acyl-sn-glycerol-3-phosphate acyltransferase